MRTSRKWFLKWILKERERGVSKSKQAQLSTLSYFLGKKKKIEWERKEGENKRPFKTCRRSITFLLEKK